MALKYSSFTIEVTKPHPHCMLHSAVVIQNVCQAPRRQHHSVDLLEDIRVDWKIVVLCTKQSNYSKLCILSTLAIYTVACSQVIYTSGLLLTQSSSTNIAARRFSCCTPIVWNSLPSFVCTADSFTSFRSQLKTSIRHVRQTRHLQDIWNWFAPRAMIPLPDLSWVINSLLTYLITYLLTYLLIIWNYLGRPHVAVVMWPCIYLLLLSF